MKDMKGCDAAIKEINNGGKSAGNGGSMRGAGDMKYEYGARKGGKSSYAKAMNHRKSGK